jgi:hypothetical protein
MCPIGVRFQSVLCCSDGETLQTPPNRFGQVQNADIIIRISSKCNLSKPLCSWEIAHFELSTLHTITICVNVLI